MRPPISIASADLCRALTNSVSRHGLLKKAAATATTRAMPPPSGSLPGASVLTPFSLPATVMAFGGIEALREMGLRVPEDISVLGFDDVPMAAWSSNALTTIRQPVEEMADEAIALIGLGSPGSAPTEPTTRFISGTLVERMSTIDRKRSAAVRRPKQKSRVTRNLRDNSVFAPQSRWHVHLARIQSYETVKIDDRVLEVNKNAKLNLAMTSMVLPLLYAFKNPAFREEKAYTEVA